jgi:6-phosphogluconate dehydrogenase
MKNDIGLIGLGVMGQNLVLNMGDHDLRVAVYNRTRETTDAFLAGEAAGRAIGGFHSLEELVGSLERPRRVMLMIKAGAPVDHLIEELLPLLEQGDIIIDGGNSNFRDTIRRTAHVEEHGKFYLGTGISGGEEGARSGPSIMPGGSVQGWEPVRPIFQSVAAHVDSEPCCEWVGSDGAGHFVKMVHNGIDYGDMQLIAEAYQLLRDAAGLTAWKLAAVFQDWNQGVLDSYLIEITADIIAYRDAEGEHILEMILDSAGQKGTGRWTAVEALNQGIPLSMIVEAVLARSLSSLKEERVRAAQVLRGPVNSPLQDSRGFIDDVEHAVYAAKIISYTQGFMLLQAAAGEFVWDIDYGSVAQMWRGGCIIRSAFLGNIREAYQRDTGLVNLLLDPFFSAAVEKAQAGWRRVVARAVEAGIPVPAMSSALAFYDGYRSDRLPANLIQAQRDYFGAHTYERVDHPRNVFFHTNWTGEGGDVTAGSYEA